MQPKYPKTKPTIQIKLYIEEDDSSSNNDQAVDELGNQLNSMQLQPTLQTRPGSSLSQKLSSASSLNNSSEVLNMNRDSSQLRVKLIEEEGYFQIGKSSPNSQVFILTITIAFAKNLIRVS